MELSLRHETLAWLRQGTVMVGVSGGRDSIALLARLAGLDGCRPAACHVHHGIRQGTADADAEFTRQMAARLGVPFHILNADVPAMARQRRISIEEAARLARQECFAKWSAEGLGDVVALAHHRDDQAETVMMNLCRGGGGIRGMRPVSSWPGGLTVVRPLLSLSREDITNYLEANDLDWIEDETNAQSDYTRNAIRHEILPRLSRMMRRDVSLPLSRTARLSEENSLALDQAVEMLNVIDPQGRLYLPAVWPMPDALKKAVVFRYLRDHHAPGISEEHVLRVLKILPHDAHASRASLPGGWMAVRKERRLKLIPPHA